MAEFRLETERLILRDWRAKRNAERDFDHPKVSEGDPLRPHVLYEMELNR